ncbi:MAG: AAA family ATPase [Deltaproteobacteria bacterium]|nr:AAA family ATPase [Deltaproteobacteria bacterium]
MSKLKKALEKAKETRIRENGQILETPVKEQVPVPPPPLDTQTTKPEPVVKKPGPRTTKRVEIDREMLIKNKVITLYHHDRTADKIRILRTQVLEKLKATGGNSILISSPNPGEGKTMISINLAMSMTQEVNRTTLLVDADLRKPFVHRYFGFEAEKGLGQYLLGEIELAEALVNPGIDKLTILPGGNPLPSSTEYLASPRMQSLVKELKERYEDRIIIFDTTSLLTRADPIVFSENIDGIILIIEAEKTSTHDIERTLEILKDRPILGTLYNKSRNPKV